MKSVSLHQDLLLHALANFFSSPDHVGHMVDVIEGRSCLSLRILDWFATNFSKKHNVILHSDAGAYFNIYMDYRAQLRAFSKQFFDPFRRKDKFVFHYGEGLSILTTIGQLNFFRWAISNGILRYIAREENLRVIEADMLRSHRDSQERHAAGEDASARRKRFELSKNTATKAMTKHVGTAVLRFG